MTKMVNTFGHGMDKDSSKNKYDNAHYYDANNIRIITQEGLTSGAIVDMLGTRRRINFFNLHYIVGYCVLREEIIIFLTANPTTTPDPVTYDDYIVRLPISVLQGLTGTDTYSINYNDYHEDQVSPDDGYNLIYKAKMGFCIANPIKAIPRWETDFVKKVYWTDGYNNLRWINVVHDDDTNDLVTLPVDRLEVIGNLDLTQPVITDIINGNIRSGKIAYAYQLYMLNGSQTIVSPVSDMFHVTEPSDTDTSSLDYYGSHIDENTKKGFIVEFDIDSQYYTRARLIAIHYTTLEDEPEIRIVEEQQISPTDTSIIFTDTGESIGNLTVEEIRILSTSLFTPIDIETKNNILFAGGITEDAFDVDYDARAYRFAGSSSTGTAQNYAALTYNGVPVRDVSRIYEEDGSYFVIYSAGITRNGAGGTADLGDWEYYNSSNVYQSGYAGYDQSGYGTAFTIPEDADCINVFNDLDNKIDTNRETTYRYQSDGITLGGEGPNVSFEFNIEEIQLCDDDTAISKYIRQDISSDPDNPSYQGYASPKYGGGSVVGYHRAEVYRFGIVFFDEKGRNSFVKWICDIAMPSISEHTMVSWNAADTSITARVLGVIFTVDNLDTIPEAKSYQIVRVKRESNDRSILAQGLLSDVYSSGTDAYHVDWNTPVTPNNSGLFHFMSPEIAFNQNLKLNGNIDFIQVISKIDNSQGYDSDAGTATRLSVSKQSLYVGYNAVDEIDVDKFSDIDEGFIIKQDGVGYTMSIYDYVIANQTNNTEKVICFLVDPTNNTLVGRSVNPEDRVLINYRRNIHESRYGGITYNARKRNEYIKAGGIGTISGASSVSDVFGGDTYIGMFDCLFTAQLLSDSLAPSPYPEAIYFPCETSINLPLRRPSCISRVKESGDSYLIQEELGVHKETGGSLGTYTQLEDYFAYNTAYSRENDIKIFTDKPFDWREIETFDVKTRASLTKTNGEFADSWLRFPANQFIEVDPQYGPLTALKVVNSRLLYFQTQAFGTLSVNERALIETQNVSQLSLGVAGLLDRYDYAKTNIGCYHWRQLTLSPNGLYWVDFLGKAAYRYAEGIEEVSLMKGMDSWFRENLINGDHDIPEGLHMFHDPEFKEVYIVDNDNDWGLIYNELTDSYVCFTHIQPELAMNYLDKILGWKRSISTYGERHNDIYAERGELYSVDSLSSRELSVTLLVNPSNSDIAIFNNFEWLTEVTEGVDVDQPQTWKTLEMWNDYQNTGVIDLVVGQSVKRRMRKWRFTIPRGIFLKDGVTNADNKYARMRDSHLFAKFTYLNETPNRDTRKFVAHDVITSHTISNK